MGKIFVPILAVVLSILFLAWSLLAKNNSMAQAIAIVCTHIYVAACLIIKFIDKNSKQK